MTPYAGESEDGAGGLPRRMMHVSRLATIGEMAAGIAHELNQPLTAIANYAQACDRLLARSQADAAELRQALQEIAAQAVRAGEIIRRLRSLAGNPPLERVPVDLNTVIQEILPLVQTDARAHGARLGLELATDLPTLELDRVQIQHLVLNLVRNGLEALALERAADRQLTIQSRQVAPQELELAVCDNGAGVDDSVIERMFDPFFSTKDSGTGLGLPISNTIARAHGGRLGYRSNVPRGACFYLRLPLAD
jgi:two-component system sensor kinase FixL